MIMRDLPCLTSEVQLCFEFLVNLHYREFVDLEFQGYFLFLLERAPATDSFCFCNGVLELCF